MDDVSKASFSFQRISPLSRFLRMDSRSEACFTIRYLIYFPFSAITRIVGLAGDAANPYRS